MPTATGTPNFTHLETAPAIANREAVLPEHFRILLIEDDPSDAGLISAYLSACSRPRFSLCHARSLQAGRDWIAQTKFDAILLDLNLPDSSGLDTFGRLQQESHSVPVVILSGAADELVAVSAIRNGAQDVLSKYEHLDLLLPKAIQYAVERSRRQHAEGEIRSASFVQQRLYPKTVPAMSEIDVAGRCDPAECVGGDYYDYLALDPNTLLLAVGDVSGHDVASAMVMAETRAAFRTLAKIGGIPRIVDTINELLVDDDLDHFVSLHVAKLDVTTGQYCYASAGQPAEILRADGTAAALNEGGPPLGVDSSQHYRVRETQIEPGEILLLYTDGITERSDHQRALFGVPNMMNSVRDSRNLPADQIVNRLFDAANAFAGEQLAHDDMTAVILKMT